MQTEPQYELPIRKGVLAIPCITTDLITLAANIFKVWAALAGPHHRLLGGILWTGGCKGLLTIIKIGTLMLLYLFASNFGTRVLMSSVPRRLDTPEEGLHPVCD